MRIITGSLVAAGLTVASITPAHGHERDAPASASDTMGQDIVVTGRKRDEVMSTIPAPVAILRPGMVLTIEPGLYVSPAEGVPEHFCNMGIRIEDDAVVTENGCELLTRGVPVKADEIETVMRG